MVLKKSSQTLEHANFVAGENKDKLPKEVMKEIESFVKRNSLVEIASSLEDKSPIFHCCPQCLKAHVIKKANDKIKVKNLLSEILDCEMGHDGYYLDGDELVKV